MKVGKPKSKRTPVRLRHKIEKASNAKQRKQRREARKNPQWRSRVKKDPGIPNLFPYKAKLLAEMEEKKREKAEEQQRRREVAKAQREGRAVGEIDAELVDGEEDEVLLDEEELGNEDEEMEEGEGASGNPMAALLASARERADAYAEDDEDDDESDDAEDEDEGWAGRKDPTQQSTAKTSKNPITSVDPTQSTTKVLPQAALDDPMKACTKLLHQMQQTQNGIQKMLDHYHIPPLVTAGSDLPTRFLVEVARKRGRLGRGGVPNLHSAALTVLGDLNEGRMALPAVETVKVGEKRVKGKRDGAVRGDVRVVEKLAEPFRIEGLWGGDEEGVVDGEMVVET